MLLEGMLSPPEGAMVGLYRRRATHVRHRRHRNRTRRDVVHAETICVHIVAGDWGRVMPASCVTPRVTARCALSSPHYQNIGLSTLMTCGNSTTIALASLGRNRGQTRCRCACRQNRTMQVAGLHARRDGRVVYTQPSSVRALLFLPLRCARADTPTDRLARASIRVSRRRCGARRVRGSASMDEASE